MKPYMYEWYTGYIGDQRCWMRLQPDYVGAFVVVVTSDTLPVAWRWFDTEHVAYERRRGSYNGSGWGRGVSVNGELLPVAVMRYYP